MAIEVELVVKSVLDGIPEQDLQNALGKLYGKPAESFTALTQSIYGMKQPYTLIKGVTEEVAKKHQARVSKLGLISSIETGLSLVPIDSDNGEDENTDTSAGTARSSDQQPDSSIKRTLDNAKSELETKKLNKQKQAAERVAANKKAQQTAAREATEKKARAERPVADVFTAEYVDKSEKNRKVLSACLSVTLAVAVGAWKTGYFDQSNPTIDAVAQANELPIPEMAAAIQATAAATAELTAAAGTASQSIESQIEQFESRATAATAAQHFNSSDSSGNLTGSSTGVSSAATNQAGSYEQSTSNATGAQYRDKFFANWVQRQAQLAKITERTNTLTLKRDLAAVRELISKTDDIWLAIHAQHKLAMAEQLNGNTEDSENRMSNLFVDLMKVRELPEKIAALADHAQTWHLILNDQQAANTLGQMENLAVAVTKPRAAVIANISMAHAYYAAGQIDLVREKINLALESAQQLRRSDESTAADEAMHFLALNVALNKMPRSALQHAANILNKSLKEDAYYRISQTFSALGMDQYAQTAMQAIKGEKSPPIDRAELQKMLENGPALSSLND